MTRLFAGTPFDRPPRCERCGALEADCACPPPPPARVPPEQQTVRLSVEKRKKGKVVTVASGLTDAEPHLQELLSQLQSVCGAGGAVKNGLIEVQGNHQERVRAALSKMGYRIAP